MFRNLIASILRVLLKKYMLEIELKDPSVLVVLKTYKAYDKYYLLYLGKNQFVKLYED